jgi:succinate dehydrogenase / fumarate reductase cytochrome b subunit
MSDDRPGLAMPPGQLPPLAIDPDAVSLSRGMTTSIGKKYTMAWCGLFWCLFLVVHLIGNLTIYAGAATFNGYAHKLESLGPFLIIAEIGLVVFLLLHVVFGVAVTLGNWRARPVAYEVDRSKGGRNVASSTMIYTGIVILAFIVLHLVNLKFGAHGERDGLKDLYTSTVALFTDPAYVIAYVVAVVLVGLHAGHAVQSGFRTIGVHQDKYTPKITAFSWIFGVIVFLGYASIPLWAWFGGAAS